MLYKLSFLHLLRIHNVEKDFANLEQVQLLCTETSRETFMVY